MVRRVGRRRSRIAMISCGVPTCSIPPWFIPRCGRHRSASSGRVCDGGDAKPRWPPDLVRSAAASARAARREEQSPGKSQARAGATRAAGRQLHRIFILSFIDERHNRSPRVIAARQHGDWQAVTTFAQFGFGNSARTGTRCRNRARPAANADVRPAISIRAGTCRSGRQSRAQRGLPQPEGRKADDHARRQAGVVSAWWRMSSVNCGCSNGDAPAAVPPGASLPASITPPSPSPATPR